MTSYRVLFHRYNFRHGSRFSVPVFLQASGTRDALDRAELMIAGMRAESPEDEFTVAIIENQDLRGTSASELGQTIWETDEEVDERQKGDK